MSSSSKQRWDALKPLLRLEGSGSRDFLHGQTSADLLAAETGSLLRCCWRTAKGRVRTLWESSLDGSGADMVGIAGAHNGEQKGSDTVPGSLSQARRSS